MSKRANGEGTVFERKDKNLWVAKVNLEGKYVVRYAKTQKLALEKLAELNRENLLVSL